MADSVLVDAQQRTGRGTRGARRLRKQGLIPAVMYGHGEQTVALAIPGDELQKAIRHGVRVLDLKADGKTEKVLIRDIQWDHLGLDILHVDFTRVAADERIHVTVPLELRGIAPGVGGGGTLDQPMHTLAIECLALDVPDHIRVSIGELQVGGAIHVRDLVLPEGVKALADPDALVVQVTAKLAEPEAAAATPVGEAVEPEVIGRQREAAEEEGE